MMHLLLRKFANACTLPQAATMQVIPDEYHSDITS
jgi:hypothetical protein